MQEKIDAVIEAVSTVVLGKRRQIRLALCCLFSGGHLLIEDAPGVGKTTLASALARTLGLTHNRVQFTSDLLPGDILGASIFEQDARRFVFHPGPVFTNLLLADEINRATPKTQSALLEAMEERQVTFEGATRELPKPFYVIATQNPLEHSGVFPLPDSQLDRFLMRIQIGRPERADELAMLKQGESRRLVADLEPLLGSGDALGIQAKTQAVHASDAVLDYILDLLEFSRQGRHFTAGLSPRAGLALLSAARTWAWLEQRPHVLPEDVQAVLPYVVGHRLKLKGEHREYSFSQTAAPFLEAPIP